MTDKIKERLYKISHSKHFEDIYIGFMGILLLYLVASLVFNKNVNASLFTSIFLIGYFVYTFIKSFKKYDSYIIKKNKLSLILLSSTESVSSILLIILCIILFNYLPLNMGYIWGSIIAILLLIVLLIVSNKISQYFKKKIVH